MGTEKKGILTKSQKIIELYEENENFNRKRASKKYGINIRWIYRVLKRHKEGKYPCPKFEQDPLSDKISKAYKNNSGVIEVNSFNCHTIEQALDISDVDLERWEVEKYTINSWAVTMKLKTQVDVDVDDKPIYEDIPTTKTNWQIKIWLKPKIVQPIEIALRSLIKEIPKYTCPQKKFKIPKTPYAAEMALYDAHIGKLAWKQEVGQGDYDIDISPKIVLKACGDNLNHISQYTIEKIFFVLGNDYMHVENYLGTTPKGGHQLDVDSRLPKIYLTAKECIIKALYMCLEVAPTEVLWIPGNHDLHASFFMSEVVKEHFKNEKNITVDNSPEHRKARLWGKLLVGFAHDASVRQVNFVNMLPQFFPDLWGKSFYREWHVGHKHKKEETKYKPTLTMGGTIIRQIPTLSTIDFWHYDNIFVDAVPAGESFIWCKNNGIIAHYTANIRY
jgi:hypothetical protein